MKIMIVTHYSYPKVGSLKNYALKITRGMKINRSYEICVVISSHICKQKVEETIVGRCTA